MSSTDGTENPQYALVVGVANQLDADTAFSTKLDVLTKNLGFSYKHKLAANSEFAVTTAINLVTGASEQWGLGFTFGDL